MEYPLEVNEMDPEECKELTKYFKGIPSFIRVGPQGFVFPKFETIMTQLSFFYNVEIRKSDTFVVSFPRSGTTMTQELVWLIGNDLDYDKASSKYLCERYVSLRTYKRIMNDAFLTKSDKYQQRQCKDIEKFLCMTWSSTEGLNISDSRFIMSHFPFSMLPPETLDTAKVVYIARNPLDVAVSLFHLYRSLTMYEYIGDFKKFWYFFSRSSILWTPYFAHVKQAWEKRHHPNMLFMFYEDNTKDLPTAVRRISAFLNKSYSDEQIKGLCEHMKFENFKKNKSVNLEFMKEFEGFVPDEQPFIRKGKTGGWREYFDEEMTKEAATWVAENLHDTDLHFSELEDLLKENQK